MMSSPSFQAGFSAHIVIATGGSGGHLYPGLALADALRELAPGIAITFVGTTQGLDTQLVPEAGYRLVKLAVGRGSPLSIRRPGNFFRFVKSLAQCRRLFLTERPDAVVSLGGFAAAPAGVLARWLRIPLVLLEQNVIPGRVTRLLSRWADEIHLQFAESRQYLLKARGRVLHSGSPIRGEIAALLGLDAGQGDSLLVMGGSQGAQRLNELACECAPEWVAAGIPIIHLTGARDYEAVSNAYAKLGQPGGRVIKYASGMAELYQQSCLALVRAGATTAAELAVAGIPAVFIPFPAARDDHQTVNARIMAQGGAALLEPEDSLTARRLGNTVRELWQDTARRREMAMAMRAFARPDAGRVIAESILARIDV